MAAHRDVLKSTPTHLANRETPSPMRDRSFYVASLQEKVAAVVNSLTQRQARDVAEALYNAYQMGVLDK